MSPVHKVMTRYCKSSCRSTSSAQASIRSCSSLLVSGVVIETSSTFVN